MALVKNIFLILFIFSVSGHLLAQSQTEMNQDTCKEYQKVDATLNRTYKKILSKYKSDKEFISNFKKAQQAWIKFKEAEIEAIYPAKDKQTEYGSVYDTCRCSSLLTITLQRIEELKIWLVGTEEGDVCAGSVQLK